MRIQCLSISNTSIVGFNPGFGDEPEIYYGRVFLDASSFIGVASQSL